jgi:hypothetical protein
MRVVPRVGAAIAVCGVAITWAAAQQTVYVDDNCSGAPNGTIDNPYCKIQDGICAIKDDPAGGTVLVKPGVYAEAVRMFKNVSVVSTDGPAATEINASGKTCVSATCGSTTVTPCAAVYFPSAQGGGGSTNADRIEGFKITGGGGIKQTCSGTCNAQAGGGIFILNSSPTITRNVIVSNTLNPASTENDIVFRGAGIYVGSSAGSPSTVVITQNTIEGNIADPVAGTAGKPNFASGAGIYIDENSTPRVEENIIRNNRVGLASKANQYAGGGGVAVYTLAANPGTVISRNEIYGNSAADFGGGVSAAFIYNYPNGSSIQNNLIDRNDAEEGGGVYMEQSSARVVNNTITDNTADGGAGISIEWGSNGVVVTNNLVTFNVASIDGGGLYLGPQLNPTLKTTDFYGNTPNNVAGSKTDPDVIGQNGNISADPLYVSREGQNRDHHLTPGSPALDTGDNADAVGTDLDGGPRVQDGAGTPDAVVDLGGYERSPDFDGDGSPDWQDTDDDNDGVLDESDCAPRSRGVSGPAGEPGELRLSKTGGVERLKWNRGTQAHTSNVYRGDIVPGQPWSDAMTCLSDETPNRQLDDPAIPAPGQGFYYLVAGRNSCGESRAGSTGTGAPVHPPQSCSSANRETDGDGVRDLGDNCATSVNAAQADADVDWVGDLCDNCLGLGNAAQANADGDLRGDACDNCPSVGNDDQIDIDGDLRGDACDNCTATPNPDQANNDADAQGDACDLDDDNDTIADALDNCPFVGNGGQADFDADGLGDACDPDDDNDSVEDPSDNCPLLSNPSQGNLDADARGDACDNCPGTANSDQADGDADGRGNVCDNCVGTANADQANGDGDALGDVCDACPLDAANDADTDGVCGDVDNCPSSANADQRDLPDADGVGNACDADDDNDTVADASDCAPEDASASAPPAEVAALAVSRSGGTQVSWTGQGAGFRYDVAGGDLDALRTQGGVQDAACLADDVAGESWSDPRPDPAPDAGFYYLARAQNACGSAGYGQASSGAERQPAAACP